MSAPSAANRQRTELAWLLGVAALVCAPLLPALPPWAGIAVAVLLGGRALLLHRDAAPLPRWLVLAGALAALAAVGLEFRTLFGRGPGVALLAFLLALKFYELHPPPKPRPYPGRDAWVVILLACFLLLAQFFESQSLVTGAWAFACCTAIVVTLIRLHSGSRPPAPRALVGRGLALALLALPFMAALYLLFPRIDGPLWGLPRDAFSGRSGLSDTMAPGSIAKLIQSGEIAFRVRFDGPAPAKSLLYFRGPVLEAFDGRTWSALPPPRHATTAIAPAPGQPDYAYTLTLEPHGNRWLLALDHPTAWQGDARLAATGELQAGAPIVKRLRYGAHAQPTARLAVDELPSMLERALRLPAAAGERGNPRARALGAALSQETARLPAAERPYRIAARLLSRFRNEGFTYSLTPPLLGANPVDEFLFGTRRGFCEHFASAFVVVMRAAGVPARVVTGYQGGERNPLDDFWVVRQSDAHAWAEVWVPGDGWVRMDPTAAVSPARVESGLAGAAPRGEPLPPLMRIDWPLLRQLRYRWEAAQNGWNQWVLGYNSQRQQDLLERLGWPDADWHRLLPLLAAACGALLALAGLAAAWPGRRATAADAPERLWQSFCRRLARRGVARAPHEGPADFARRVAVQFPAWGPLVDEAAACYIRLRYRPPEGDDPRRPIARLRALTRTALFRRPR